jgi:hypothetical protein
LGAVSYTTAEGREQLLDAVGRAVDELARAVASLSEAYELLDEHSADELESRLFKPVQGAYGRARRAYAGFSRRHGLPEREFAAAVRGAPAHGVRGFIDEAAADVAAADAELAELQDSLLPVEVGDTELRADLAAVRTQLGDVGHQARELTRTLGR